MNILPGTIREIQTHGNLTLARIAVSDITFSSIVIETPATATYLKPGTEVQVMFKETEVIIAKSSQEISLQNRIPVRITEITKGQLLSQLLLQFHDYQICSVITSNAVNQLQLKHGSEVIAMVKTNEVMLAE